MPQQQYLSTDPNAGEDVKPQYLSTDPSLGSESSVTPKVAAGLGLATLAPAIIAGINASAGPLGVVANALGNKYSLGATAGATAAQAARGDVKGAAGTAAIGTGMALAPKAISALKSATNPAIVALRGAGGRFITGGQPAGVLARGAGALSNAAGALAVPVTLTSATYDAAQFLKQQAMDPATPPERKQIFWQILERMADPNQLR